jgi:hypothetical protein
LISYSQNYQAPALPTGAFHVRFDRSLARNISRLIKQGTTISRSPLILFGGADGDRTHDLMNAILEDQGHERAKSLVLFEVEDRGPIVLGSF